jgi:DNA-binding transcriptional ArsR family regulator
MPNGWLEERGVSRKAKSQVLRDLEAAGLVTVERRDRKSPRVTILVL